MATITDDAVCIRCWEFSETSQTVSLFTRDHGLLRGLAKGARREKGAFSGGLDVLTRGQIVAIFKPGRDLATLTAWQVQEGFPAVRRNLAANRAGFYMVGLVGAMLSDLDPHPNLFDALVAALRDISNHDAIDSATLRWQWTLLVECGYRPELNRDARTRLPLETKTLAFSAEAGGLVSSPAPRDWRVREETVALLRSIADGNALDADAECFRRANRLLAAYIRELLGRELPVMRWAFSDL